MPHTIRAVGVSGRRPGEKAFVFLWEQGASCYPCATGSCTRDRQSGATETCDSTDFTFPAPSRWAVIHGELNNAHDTGGGDGGEGKAKE